jgi:hypothetical protein
MAVAAATAALCCSTEPPLSRTRILFRLAMGQPEALQNQTMDLFQSIELFPKCFYQ